MLKISCLHTAQSNIAVFEAARRELQFDDVILKHRVRASLLADTEAAGGPTAAVLRHTADELVSVGRGADGVILTCSTLGAAAQMAAARLAIPVTRADEALAHEATRNGGLVIALCTATTTIAATRALFEGMAIAASATVEVRLVPGAWELFTGGREAPYLRLVAEAADAAAQEGGATIALAQASMAGAARLAASRPLTVPHAGLRAIVALARGAPAATSNAGPAAP